MTELQSLQEQLKFTEKEKITLQNNEVNLKNDVERNRNDAEQMI